jgi:rare lipoprotein A
MNYRAWLIVSFLVLPLLARQASDKPSPVPDKSRRSRPRTPAAEKSHPSSAGRAQSSATAESNRIPRDSERSQQTGEACFFASKVNGTPTASGRPLDSEELVAAHASFPFGSRVKITNLANGRTVEVTIIDRMPVSARIINVSEAAAKLLDFRRAGVAQVHLNLLKEDNGPRDRK